MAGKSLGDWLAQIEAYNPHEIELGLERVARVWQRLGAPPPAARIVTIAGTNGKGTCANFLDQCLRAEGHATGIYTSPHLLRFNERICIAGVAVSDASLCTAFDAVESAREDDLLTYFEFTTLAALVCFAQAHLDFVVLEVGLGGRLDAVNIIAGDVAVVTTIDLDHQSWLGDTREEIGFEKAGVFRAGRPAVCGDPDPPATLVDYARKCAAVACFRGEAFHCEGQRDRFSTWSEGYRFVDLPRPNGAPLAGFVCAIETLARLEAMPTEATLVRILEDWSLPGRLQHVAGPPPVILDVAHNPQAGRALREVLAGSPVRGRSLVVVGLLADKAASEFIDCLSGQVDEWLAVSLAGNRGRSASALAAVIAQVSKQPVTCCASVAGALAIAHARAGDDDRIVVCGSFQIVGPALAWLGLYSRPAQVGSAEGDRWSKS